MKQKDYRPQYSLSIKILSLMMSKSELKKLISDYVKTKQQNWGQYKK